MQNLKQFIVKKLRTGAKVLNDHFVRVLVIAALVIIGSMLVIQFATYQPERYTGFGLLNQEEQAGPFPANMTYNASLITYTTVANREGNVELYQIEVYIGNASTTVDPVKGIVSGRFLALFQEFVINGQDWEQQIVINFNKTLVGIKTIFFTLWQYDTSSSTFHFMNQELHIHIDILAP